MPSAPFGSVILSYHRTSPVEAGTGPTNINCLCSFIHRNASWLLNMEARNTPMTEMFLVFGTLRPLELHIKAWGPERGCGTLRDLNVLPMPPCNHAWPARRTKPHDYLWTPNTFKGSKAAPQGPGRPFERSLSVVSSSSMLAGKQTNKYHATLLFWVLWQTPNRIGDREMTAS